MLFQLQGNLQLNSSPAKGYYEYSVLNSEINASFKFMEALTKFILFWPQDLNLIEASMHLKICSTTVCVSQ